MASGFFALLDDISLLMDSSANLTKVAAKNTVGILGDDLAVNVPNASQFKASRELPVLWAISKGSIVNKIIIVPTIIALSYYFPQAIMPILLLGGLFLAYEGAHGIWGYIFPHKEGEKQELTSEKNKVKSAIITDFILSMEIVLITLSTVVNEPLEIKILVVSVISILATIGVYSIVALLVRLDDIGVALARDANPKSFKYILGMKLVSLLPIIIKILNVVGVFAMLLVAGGIFMENIYILHELMLNLKISNFVAKFISALIFGGFLMLIVDGSRYLIDLLKKRWARWQ